MPTGTKRVKAQQGYAKAKTETEEQDQKKAQAAAVADSKERVKASQDRRKAFEDRQAKIAAEKERVRTEVVVIHNPTKETLEYTYSGETYYLEPGDNEIVSLNPNVSNELMARSIVGNLGVSGLRGITFKKKVSGGKRSAADDQLVTNDNTAVVPMPAKFYNEISKVSSPGADERAQPFHYDVGGNEMDPIGEANRQARDLMAAQIDEDEPRPGRRGKVSSRGV
jgi:hypothetical protein